MSTHNGEAPVPDPAFLQPDVPSDSKPSYPYIAAALEFAARAIVRHAAGEAIAHLENARRGVSRTASRLHRNLVKHLPDLLRGIETAQHAAQDGDFDRALSFTTDVHLTVVRGIGRAGWHRQLREMVDAERRVTAAGPQPRAAVTESNAIAGGTTGPSAPATVTRDRANPVIGWIAWRVDSPTGDGGPSLRPLTGHTAWHPGVPVSVAQEGAAPACDSGVRVFGTPDALIESLPALGGPGIPDFLAVGYAALWGRVTDDGASHRGKHAVPHHALCLVALCPPADAHGLSERIRRISSALARTYQVYVRTLVALPPANPQSDKISRVLTNACDALLAAPFPAVSAEPPRPHVPPEGDPRRSLLFRAVLAGLPIPEIRSALRSVTPVWLQQAWDSLPSPQPASLVGWRDDALSENTLVPTALPWFGEWEFDLEAFGSAELPRSRMAHGAVLAERETLPRDPLDAPTALFLPGFVALAARTIAAGPTDVDAVLRAILGVLRAKEETPDAPVRSALDTLSAPVRGIATRFVASTVSVLQFTVLATEIGSNAITICGRAAAYFDEHGRSPATVPPITCAELQILRMAGYQGIADVLRPPAAGIRQEHQRVGWLLIAYGVSAYLAHRGVAITRVPFVHSR